MTNGTEPRRQRQHFQVVLTFDQWQDATIALINLRGVLRGISEGWPLTTIADPTNPNPETLAQARDRLIEEAIDNVTRGRRERVPKERAEQLEQGRRRGKKKG